MSPSWAQTEAPAIVIDSSLGDERSQIAPDRNRKKRTNVTGGAQRGSNLFHSFERFNILNSQRSVFFVPNSAVENVLTRVVGTDPSDILGTLGVEGSANLWLINPNGILFGENAILDIEGNFYATTGDAIALGDSGVFSAIDPEGSQLLSVLPDATFDRYLTADSGAIVSQAVNLTRRGNADLAFAGGTLTVEEGLRLGDQGTLSLVAYDTIETSRLNTQGGTLDIQALNGSATVGAINTRATNGTRAGKIDITAAGDVRTNDINASSINRDTDSDSRRGGNLSITTTGGGSIFNAGDLNTQSRAQQRNAGRGGNITLNAAAGGDIINEGFVRSQSNSSRGNTDMGGAITMTTTAGDILNRDVLRSQTNTREGNAGPSGNITLTASNGSITNAGNVNTQSASERGNANNGGNISMTASGDINNQGLISSYSYSRMGTTQNGGRIEILSVGGGNVTNRATLRSFSASNEGNTRRGGGVEISTVGDGTITTYGRINAQSLANGTGNAGRGGNIVLTSENGNIFGRPSTRDNGGSLSTRSVTRDGNANNAGNIEVTSEGGDIILNAYLDAKSYSLNGSSRNGGDITLEANQGSITGDAVFGRSTNVITSAVSSTDAPSISNSGNNLLGDGGNVTITAGDRISGFNIFTLSNLRESGDVKIEGLADLQIDDVQIITNEEVVGGDFSFDENPFFPSNVPGGGVNTNIPITVTQPQSGSPGEVEISSRGSLTTTNLQIISDAISPVPAGNIEIVAGTTAILDNTSLITRTNGESQAGDIIIESGDYLLLRNGTLLLADAEQDEDGGKISIRTNQVIASPDGNNDIITNASNGDGGEVFSPNATLYGFTLQTGLTTEQLRNSRSNDVSTRSEFGQDGSININAITETPNQTQSEELDDSFSTPEQLISNSCISPNSSVAGSFTIPGTGDLPPTPEDSTASVYGIGDVQTLPASQASDALSTTASSSGTTYNTANAAKQKWQLGDPIVEPESIARLADGRIVFGQSCSVL